MHRALRLAFLTVLIVAMATPVLAVDPHFVIDLSALVEGTTCRIGVAVDPGTLPEVGGLTVTPLMTSDGETGFEGQCGVADTFYFGAGLDQYFAAHAAATSIAVGKVGVLRAFGIAVSEVFPERYDAPEFVAATNHLSAASTSLTSAFFVDVITPPPTAAAPNPGDPTELTLQPVFDVDCEAYQNAYQEASLVISFWTADTYTDDANQATPGFLYSTYIMRPGIPGSGGCHYGLDPRTITGLKVGQPIVMRVNFGVSPFLTLGEIPNNYGSYAAEDLRAQHGDRAAHHH